MQDCLVKAASNCPGTIFVDQTVEGTHGEAASLRPDIVVRDEANKIIKIINVAIPFGNRWEALVGDATISVRGPF